MARKRTSSNAAPAFRAELEDIGARLASLGERSLAAGQEAAAREIEELRDGLESLVERAGAGGEQAFETVVGAVRRQPLGSIATAFAVGIGLALVFGRRA